MDLLLRVCERLARLEPGDLDRILEHSRWFARCGRWADARETLALRLTSGFIDTETLEALWLVTLSEGRLQPSRDSWAPTQVDRVAGRPSDLCPTVALAGPPSARAWEHADRLRRTFPPKINTNVRVCWTFGEPVLDYRVPLETPWLMAPGCRVTAIRVVNLPCAPEAAKLRRRLMRSVSALAFIPDPGTDLLTHTRTFMGLSADFRRVHGRSLDQVPLLLHAPASFHAGRRAELHESLGIDLPCLEGPDLLAWALLLHEVAQATRDNALRANQAG